MGRRFFHKTLPGLPIYPVLSAGFIRDIKEALLFSSMTRSCVASVAVGPYNLSRNQNHCPGVPASLSMSIFLATSRGKYTWKQTPGQSVLIFGKIIGTHCDRRDARNNTASRNRDMFWQTAIPTGTNAFQTTQRVCCRLSGSDDSKGLQLPLLCMERAGALQPPPLPFFCP